MGKTTYSQKLAYDWANKQDEWDTSFPSIEVLLLLRCNDVKSGIWEAIDDQLLPDDIDEQAKENFFKYIRENQAKCLLLLDGLDEADSFKLDMYYSLVQSKLLPACHIVITSRHEVGKKVRRYCDTLWEMVGFTKEDAESFIRKYFKGKEHLAEKLIKRLELLEYNDDDDDDDPLATLGELTKNPLNTALLCCLFEDFEDVFPTSRTKLYLEIVTFVLRRYEVKNGLESSNEDLILGYKKELLLLGSLALESLLKGESYFEKKEDTVKLINFGFLSFQQGGAKRKPCTRCAFLHKSFQEFFAGFFLAFQVISKERDFTSVVDDKRYLDKLRQVFLFMSGIIASRSEETAVSFVSGIAKKINPAGDLKYMTLACECLSECSNVKKSLETRLVSILSENLDMSSLTEVNFEDTRVYDAGAAAISQALTANSSLTSLNLALNEIGDAGASSLSQALKENSSLTSLDLSFNRFGEAGASSLSQALKINSSLTSLNLYHNRIGDAGASSLSQALTANSSLTSLDLGGNRIGEAGASSLSEALTANSSLTRLNLALNGIGDAGASYLSQALKENSSLTLLDLTFNSTGDAGASYLSQALKENSSLTLLDLTFNSTGDAGASYLSQALKENSSLTRLDLSSNSIGDAGASSLSQALTANSSLTRLTLVLTDIGDAGASSLSEALTANSSLTSLDLACNSIGEAGASSLSQALTVNSSLTSLDLSGNSIGDAGASSLSQSLTANSSLTSLNLGGNRIGEAGASSLSEALTANSSLTRLYLRDDGIGEGGVSALSQALNLSRVGLEL